MSRFIVIPAVLAGVFAPLALADTNTGFDYLAGGLQYSHLNPQGTSNPYFGQDVANSDQNLYGAYYQGAWNFTGNWFVKTEGDYGAKANDDYFQSYTGLGYVWHVNDRLRLFASVGVASYNATHQLDSLPNNTSIQLQGDDTGASAEVGFRYKVNEIWRVQPVYRYSDFGTPEQEYRIDNIFQISDHWALEGNLRYRHWGDLDESSVQIGVRYSF
ncbi:outer membrane beta-barrel protein [Gallaecimonas mangrovi]|uniref:outer membrane beta-barrel protein n=1 Tax=Gallaecimonas mangrovi TaxID=2291597 RepID=UPI000E20BACA|nr:outer membrane beta-barrel protein [Gallaecimonas mangrovi]